jgi:putative PIN family toxin of toxin-antitoxin system
VICVVLDTNVLASAIAGASNPASTPGELFRRWRRKTYRLTASAHILDELTRTLAKPYFADRFTPHQVAQAQRTLRRRGEWVAITAAISGVATHPADDLVLAAAVSAAADYLVTGDRQLQRLGSYLGIAIFGPREFLALLDRLEQDDELAP